MKGRKRMTDVGTVNDDLLLSVMEGRVCGKGMKGMLCFCSCLSSLVIPMADVWFQGPWTASISP